MNITIEKAKPSDARELLEYLKQIGGETDNLTFGREGLPFTVEEEAAFIAGLENSADGVMFVTRLNDRIVGNASLLRQPRRMNHRGEVGISVLREQWGRGIGSLLLSHIVSFAKDNRIEIIDLQVRSDNQRAIALYQKFGFVKLCSHPDFHRVDGQPVAYDYMYLLLK